MKFSKIVKELRTEISMPQDKFAKEIGYSKSIISDWENEKALPNAQALCIISKFFNVSVDYLLGIEDEWGKSTLVSSGMNNHELEHIERYRQLDTWGKERLENFLDALLESSSAEERKRRTT